MREISQKDIFDPIKKEHKKKSMLEPVQEAFQKPHFLATLCMISCFIDGLGKGKEDYLKNLEKYFPNLCKELGARVFYQKYRNGIVHEFSPKKGFGIAEDIETKGTYVEEFKVKETGQILTCINIERLKNDFENMIKNI